MAKSPVAGICPTCLHSGRCHLSSRGGDGPTHSCEEFEPGSASGAPSAALAAARSGEPAAEAAPEGPLGLCAGCSRQETCSYTRPEGGVWHCEDYA
jgi:hypothetical protein